MSKSKDDVSFSSTRITTADTRVYDQQSSPEQQTDEKEDTQTKTLSVLSNTKSDNNKKTVITLTEFLSEDTDAIERANWLEEERKARIENEVKGQKEPVAIKRSCIPFSQEISQTAHIHEIDLYELNDSMDEDVDTQMSRLKVGNRDRRMTNKKDLFSYATKQAEHKYKDLPGNITRELTSEEIDDLLLVFRTFDRRNKGVIDKVDLQIALKSLGFNLSKKVRREMIALLDTKKRGRVDFIGFLEFVIKYQDSGPDPFEELMRVFNTLDDDGKGYVTFDDMRNVSEKCGAKLSNRMITEMIDEADENGDRKVTKQEFIKVMLNTNKFQMYAFAEK